VLIVLIVDQVIPVIYIYRNLAAVILTSR
jgi:hypothetical protein